MRRERIAGSKRPAERPGARTGYRRRIVLLEARARELTAVARRKPERKRQPAAPCGSGASSDKGD